MRPLSATWNMTACLTNSRRSKPITPIGSRADSPTQRAGAKPSEKFEKVRHPAPILSLANAFGADDARAWFERVKKLDDRVEKAKFVVEPKIDGLIGRAALSRWHVRAGSHTRRRRSGRGYHQQPADGASDSTKNSSEGQKISKSASYLVVRGEAFIPIKEFEALNKKLEEAGEKTYLNPRNTAAGSLRQLDPVLTASRPDHPACLSDRPLRGRQSPNFAMGDFGISQIARFPRFGCPQTLQCFG
jgi:DNA ligase (NAD+)